MSTANSHWFTRDHVLVVQAARNMPTEPIYAQQLWDQAEDPQGAALYLLELLLRERIGPMVFPE